MFLVHAGLAGLLQEAASICVCAALVSLIYVLVGFAMPPAASERGNGDDAEPDHTDNSAAGLKADKCTDQPILPSAAGGGEAGSNADVHAGSDHTDCSAVDLNGDDDEELVAQVVDKRISSHSLEGRLKDCHRAVRIRRKALSRITGKDMKGLPIDGFSYDSAFGQCCEMPIGYVQIPAGITGPLLLDGKIYHLPLATTEGCLVASINRGCKAITESGGARSAVVRDGITRAPVVKLGSALRAAELMEFIEDNENFDFISVGFRRSSKHTKLQSVKCAIAGRLLYIRFRCTTGDAMGMNMISKGVGEVLHDLHEQFPDMEIISISGNYCADKKPAAINWIDGRGKYVVCEAIIKGDVVRRILKTTVTKLIEINVTKNLIGSAIAGAVGGCNAHASNIVTGLFIATGQDPAQNVESSNCITVAEPENGGDDVYISVTMPSIEVGTVGGGTKLASQATCLDLLDVKGGNKESPGANARRLACIVAGGVLAGELSLLSALTTGDLVKSHMKYNRSSKNIAETCSS